MIEVVTIMLWILIRNNRVSVYGNTMQSEDIMINVEKGLAMLKSGFVATRRDKIYASIFIKIPNPSVQVEKLCGRDCSYPESTWKDWMHWDSKCRQLDKTPMDNNIHLIRSYQTHHQDLRSSAIECLKECFGETDCLAIGVSPQGNCLLRKNPVEERLLVENPGAMELDISCVAEKNKTRFCNESRRKNPLAYKLQEEFNHSVMRIWARMKRGVDEDTHRKKRGIANGILLGVLAGITAFEQARIERHIKKLAGDFEVFKERQTRFNEVQMDFNKKYPGNFEKTTTKGSR